MDRGKKFTPGPWAFREYDGGNVIESDFGLPVVGGDSSEGEIDSLDDANLIAAAPELLEACENILKVIDCFGMSSCPHVHEVGGCGGEDEDCDWLINAREAIKKAYGETK